MFFKNYFLMACCFLPLIYWGNNKVEYDYTLKQRLVTDSIFMLLENGFDNDNIKIYYNNSLIFYDNISTNPVSGLAGYTTFKHLLNIDTIELIINKSHFHIKIKTGVPYIRIILNPNSNIDTIYSKECPVYD
jgi:hypothetical protein